MVRRVASARSGDGSARLVAPLVLRHAARLEQVDEIAMLGNADVAARALRAVQSLYSLDVVFASTVDSVAWAVRGAARPELGLAQLIDEHRRGAPLAGAFDVDAIPDALVTVRVVELVERLRGLLRGGADIGLVIPTAESLRISLGESITMEESDDACGAFLRVAGAMEPDVVLRVGDGERGSVAAGTCDFFGIPLIEVGDVSTEGVASARGDAFVATEATGCWLFTSVTELPPETDVRALSEASLRLHADVREGQL